MDQPVVMVGTSAAIRHIDEEIRHASGTDAKVLVTGESGVGKEIVARLIHHRGTRRLAPLITVNCAGLPDSLLESELFGHVNGSGRDARREKPGWLELAHEGTIFVDEVGEMSLGMQAHLLRFLETGQVPSQGSDRCLDVRVITASSRRLVDRIADQSFREDLFYRLNVIHIEVPPLRDRAEDVPLLLRHFVDALSTRHRLPTPPVAPEVLTRLMAYRWPGNVRELKNLAERLVLRARGARITEDLLPSELWLHLPERPREIPSPAAVRRTCDSLFQTLLTGKDSFWTAVYDPFKAHDLTREDVREVIRMGLEHTRGNYTLLVRSFNMPAEDYKPFLNFLRKYDCHVPYQRFRTTPSALAHEGLLAPRAVRAST